MVLSAGADKCCLELNTWRPLQRLTKSLASSKAAGQKYDPTGLGGLLEIRLTLGDSLATRLDQAVYKQPA